jgi:hypothetical protein
MKEKTMSKGVKNNKPHLLIAAIVSGALLPWPVLSMESTSAVPDFSGRWGRNAFNFEPMPSGPRPLTNLKRLADGTGDPGQLVGDYRNPILKPEIADVVKKKGEFSISGQAYPDPSNQCGTYAPPFTYAMQLGMEMFQKKDGITIIYNQDDQVRHVRLNSEHPKYVKASAMGDSIGHYEGDTLVVDTVGIENAPFAMVDRYGTPHSDALRVVERYRLIDGAESKAAQERYEKAEGRVGGVPGAMALDPDPSLKGLQIQITVEDPNVFTTPWTVFATYRHMSARQSWQELVCAENPTEYYPGMLSAMPKADKPDF